MPSKFGQAEEKRSRFGDASPVGVTGAAEGIGPFQAAAISAGRGLTKIGRAVGLAEPEKPIVTKAFRELKQERPISTFIGEVAGESAPFLLPGTAVGGIAGLGTRAAASAALGATEGALIARGENRDVSEQITTGGLGGLIAGSFELALPRISRIGRQTIRRILKKNPTEAIIDANGKLSDDFIEAIRSEGRSIDDVVAQVNEELLDEGFNPEQLARKAFLEAQDIAPTRAQVTRDATDFQLQQEAAKTSTRVRNALEQQEAILTTRFDNAVFETGGKAVTPTSTVTDSLVSKATGLDQEISDLYNLAREIAPGEKNIRFSDLAQKLRELAPANTRSGGNISAIVGELKAKGVLGKKFDITGRIDVETAEEVRKFMNSLYDPKNGFGNGLLRELKDSLDDDVFRAAGQDVFNDARAAKSAFEQELARAKISKFDSRRANLVRDVLENKIDPDRFSEQVVFGKKYRAADLKQLRDYITTDIAGLPDEAGASAFNDLRANVLDVIKNKSFIGPEDALGNRALSRAKLESTLNSIGNEKLGALFNPDELEFLRDMIDVSKLREPVRGTALGRGPSAQAVGLLEERLKKIPIFGSLVSVINVDSAGKAVLKGNIETVPNQITASVPRQLTAQAAAVGGVGLLPEEE